MEEQSHVIIIGAGPAGLAAAACLEGHGISYTLLERDALPAASIRRIDPSMEMLSPRILSRLPDMSTKFSSPYLSFREFTGALEQYVKQRRIQVRSNAEVVSVTRADQRFSVQVKNENGAINALPATHVINATGIISSPLLPPSFHPDSFSLRWKHSIDCRAADFRNINTLLVIGGGASAAEVLDNWLEVRTDNSRAFLSLRSKLKAFTNPILGLDIHYWIWLHERLPASFFGWRPARFPEYMNGTKVLPAIKRGLITCVDDIKEYGTDSVTLHSGETIRPDLTVFATGFRYSTDHLAGLLDFDHDSRPRVRRCESTRTPGLYLLGFKFGRTFASPYIRGIARDAGFIARRIARESLQRMLP